MLQFEVNDMTCNHCVASITKAITSAAPDASVKADLATHRVTVTGDVTQESVVAALDDVGFTARPIQG